jgi:hypothetical protein
VVAKPLVPGVGHNATVIATNINDVALGTRPLIVDGDYIWGTRKASGQSLVRATQSDLSDASVVATLPSGYWNYVIRVAPGKLAAYVVSSDPEEAGFYIIDDSNPAHITYGRKSAGFPVGYPYPQFQNMAKSDDGQYLWACTYGIKDAINPPYYIYRSTDYGETWGECYTHLVAENTHIHAIEWDPYRNRIWGLVGDMNEGGRPGIIYSDDYGAVGSWTLVEGTWKPHMHTCIIPLPGKVLFGTDRAPAGILTWTPPGGANAVVDTDIAQTWFAQSVYNTDNLGFAYRPVWDLSRETPRIVIPFGNVASYAQAWLLGGNGVEWSRFYINTTPATNNDWVRYLCGITPDGWIIGKGTDVTSGDEYVYRFLLPDWE